MDLIQKKYPILFSYIHLHKVSFVYNESVKNMPHSKGVKYYRISSLGGRYE